MSEQTDENVVTRKSEGYNVKLEEDLVFSKRCKIFFKINDSYENQGISVISVKLVDGEKYQLIAGTDTMLWVVLKLIVFLNKSIPLKKSGVIIKVMLLCSPIPGVPPVSILIKVKTAEDADEVIYVLNQCKK